MTWEIGKGEIYFWNDIWFKDRKLTDLVYRNLTEEDRRLKVQDLYSWKRWDFNKLVNTTNRELAEQISGIQVIPDQEDQPKWVLSQDGGFSTKETWEEIRSKKPQSLLFTIIWSKIIPVKMSFLIWRLLYRWIPTDDIMQSKGLTGASKCQCCSQVETIQHVFINSQVAKAVWRHFGTLFDVKWLDTEHFNHMLSAWLFSANVSTKLHARRVVPIAITWFLWHARNEAKHRGIKITKNRIIWNVNNFLCRLSIAGVIDGKCWTGDKQAANRLQIQLTPAENRKQSPRLISWVPPQRGQFKLNIDGSFSKESNAAGCGGILRDEKGRTKWLFYGPLQAENAFMTELQGLERALHICHEEELENIYVEMDAKAVVDIVNKRRATSWRVCYIIKSIRHLCDTLKVKLVHIYREANQAADFLANWGREQEAFVISENIPLVPKLRGIISMDQRGLPYVRR